LSPRILIIDHASPRLGAYRGHVDSGYLGLRALPLIISILRLRPVPSFRGYCSEQLVIYMDGLLLRYQKTLKVGLRISTAHLIYNKSN
jgi:hypothetical protein